MLLTDFSLLIIVTIILKISKVNHHNSLNHDDLQQGKKASNPRPTVLETAALPAELFPCIQFKIWWTVRDSNPGPTGYEPAALPTELTVQLFEIAVTA